MYINIHPILVHFPIALFTLYSSLELISWLHFNKLSYWFYIRAVVLSAGFLGSLAAKQTGEWASQGVTDPTVSTHELFANITIIIFGVLTLLYLIEWIYKERWEKKVPKNILPVLVYARKIQQYFFVLPVLMTLAFLGLASVTITGALGGSMVFGPENDPLTSFIYHLIIRN